MTTVVTPPRGRIPGRAAGWLRSSAGIAVAMGVMNVATYGFQMVAARVLGPSEYGAVAGLMAMLMVIAVLQLGLQATAARRIASAPDHVSQIERVVLRVTYRAALVLGAVLLVAAPLVEHLLQLDSLPAAVLLAVAAVPLTVSGGQAGILQGERRWLPLAVLYLAVGVPRLVLGTLFVLLRPTETSAMAAVLLGLLAPVAVGWWALRGAREPGRSSDEHASGSVLRETVLGSQALLAFFVLSNADVVVARHVLDDHAAGLYAAGLILTKAVLFLPQFVVVVAFPSMSTADARRRALVRSLAVVAALGALCTLGALVLSGLATVFIGGREYADVQDRLWLFAVLGTVLAMLQLLVYSVLARQGSRSSALVWAGVVVLVAVSLAAGSLTGLLTSVVLVDSALFAVLLGLSLWRLGVSAPPRASSAPSRRTRPAAR